MRKKRTSKRRWKARYRLGKWIPEIAVVEHNLRAPDAERDHLRCYVRRKMI